MRHAWNITKAQMNKIGGRKAKMTPAVGYNPWPRTKPYIPPTGKRRGWTNAKVLASGIRSVATQWDT